MKLSFEISKLALADLENIWEYTVEQWSIEQANKYYNDIFSAIMYLCENPDSGKPVDEIKIGHRRLNVKSHMILYKIKKETILIDRVLHQRMDIERHFSE